MIRVQGLEGDVHEKIPGNLRKFDEFQVIPGLRKKIRWLSKLIFGVIKCFMMSVNSDLAQQP